MKRIGRIVFIAACSGVLAYFMAALTSCATESHVSRGSLSGAMDSAKDNDGGDHAVRQKPRTVKPAQLPKTETPADEAPVADSASGGETLESLKKRFLFGVRGGSSVSQSCGMGKDIDGDILAGLDLEKAEFLACAGFKSAEPAEGSGLDQSIRGSIVFLRAGGEFRFVPLTGNVWMSPYLGIGIGAFLAGWEFRNPVVSGSDTISGDSLTGCVFSSEAGVYLVKNRYLSLSAAVIPEVYVFDGMTQQGFTNDYFRPYGSVKLAGEMLFR